MSTLTYSSACQDILLLLSMTLVDSFEPVTFVVIVKLKFSENYNTSFHVPNFSTDRENFLRNARKESPYRNTCIILEKAQHFHEATSRGHFDSCFDGF